MTIKNRRSRAPLLGILLLLCAGCAATSSPSRFYLLSSLTGNGNAPVTSPSENALFVGIGPVELPRYLDRPQIMVRASGNRLELSEFDKWAEPLDRGVTRVLLENLSLLLNTDRVVPFPFRNTPPVDYQVVATVTRFDGIPGKDAELKVNWSLVRGRDKKLVLMKRSRFYLTASEQGHEAMVSLQSRLLAELSREIASSIISEAAN